MITLSAPSPGETSKPSYQDIMTSLWALYRPGVSLPEKEQTITTAVSALTRFPSEQRRAILDRAVDIWRRARSMA